MDEILPFTYRYNTSGIIRIRPIQPPGTRGVSLVIIDRVGTFSITATTTQTDRYNPILIPSPRETATTRRRPVIAFPASFIAHVTFGETYNFDTINHQARFIFPAGTPDPSADGVTINYAIVNQSRANVATSSGPRGTIITINNVGTFSISPTTTATTLFDAVTHTNSQTVRVVAATPRFPTTVWNALPSGITTFFVGDTVTITPPPQLIFPSVALQNANGIRIVYIVGGTEITGTTFTRAFAGRFDIRAETRSNGNYTNAQIWSSSIPTFNNPPPPRIVRDRVNNQTLVFQERSIPQSPDFIQASPRGFPEWFAVVDQRSFHQIRDYANGTTGPFTRAGQLVPFNNIVTSLMDWMANLFSGIQNFNQDISSWDTSRVTNMSNMFTNARVFNQHIGSWNTSQVTNMTQMFYGATNFNNGGSGVMGWDTSRVQNMDHMFNNAVRFNSQITHWNTTAVTSMNSMFFDATAFNRWISWDTSRVQGMAVMFMRAISFNDHLNLNTQSVTNMNSMFSGATSFTGLGNIGGWNTSRVTAMNSTFQGARSFSQSLGWNTSQVRDMNNMFNAATSYNGHMFWWDTSRVTIMAGMFGSATSFNQVIGRWNTSQVTNMAQMFDGATNFNSPINTGGLETGAWNTSAVTNMGWMFRNARNFNQPIGNWNTSRVTDMQHMFEGATIFNNGHVVQWNFDGFLNQDERNRFFRGWVEFAGADARNFSFNLNTFLLSTPRQTMNWNINNVRNMNFMFNNATNFFNVDLRTWALVGHSPVGFRRGNCPMVSTFTPFAVFLRADRGR